MSEPEELITDAARHATVFARDLWRRHRSPGGGPRRLGLADVAPRIDLLITAVFGEGRRIRVAQPPAPVTLLSRAFGPDRGPRARRAVPATDGVSVWLPADLDVGDDTLAHLLYRTIALQQAMRARRGSARLPRQDWPGLLADVYLLLEAYAADDALVALLPGLEASIDTLRRTALAQRPPAQDFPPSRQPVEQLARELLASACGGPRDSAFVAATPHDSLGLAKRIVEELAPGTGAARRFGAEPLLKDWWTGELRRPSPANVSVSPSPDEADPGADSESPPRSGRLRRSPKLREAAEDEDDDPDEPSLLMVQGDDPHPHAEDPMGLRRPVDRDEETSADQLGDMVSDLPEARAVSTPAPPKEVLLSDDPPDAHAKRDADKAAAGTAIRYPEWDYRTQSFRQPGAAVRPSTPQPGPEEWVRATLAEHGALLGAIRRRFEMLRARRVRLKRQLDGDEIDLDACIEHQANLRAGRGAADGLYELRRAAERDVAILLLIDVSGSTDGWISANRRVIDVEREALLLVSVALQSLGEPFAIEAFSGEGPQRVTSRTLKRFDEPYGLEIALRIAGLEPERYTRAGAAIRHASALLMRRRAHHRLLLLLSDGKPNDVDEYEGRYGAEDMRQAVIEAKLQGIFPFCLTIDRHAASYLPRVFGANQYALLAEPERLPTVLVEWMKRLIVA